MPAHAMKLVVYRGEERLFESIHIALNGKDNSVYMPSTLL